MSINLGNVVGLLRSETAPSKKYVIWAKILNPSFPDIVELHYWDENNNQWIPVTDPTTQHWLRPVLQIRTTPTVSPGEGDRYLVGNSGASGAWSGQEDKITTYRSGVWQFQTPLDGYIVSNRSEINKLYDYRGVHGAGGAWFENDFQVPISPEDYIAILEKGAPNGVAALDDDGLVIPSQLDPETLPFSPTVPTSWPGGTETVKQALEYLRTLVGLTIENPLLYRGEYDASSDAFPTSGGTGAAGVPAVGNIWRVSMGGTLPGHGEVEPGAKLLFLGSGIWDITY